MFVSVLAGYYCGGEAEAEVVYKICLNARKMH